ncbi:CDP-diacylglycerol--glycerol-3-phosphate 3-phosphatidyltransferase [Eubacteriales bacterium KG127]
MNLPNKLTISRVILVPVFILFYTFELYLPALVVFVVASFTDYLDGYLARKHNLVSNFGKIMDPLADKVLVYSAFALLLESGLMPAWMLIIILTREFTVAGMRTVAAAEGVVIAAALSGKIKTVLQMIAVPLLLLVPVFSQGTTLHSWISIVANLFLWLSLIMTVYSGIEYVSKNIKIFSM